MQRNGRLWQQSQQQLSQFLIPLVEVWGCSERRVAATRYVEGLLLPGRRNTKATVAFTCSLSPNIGRPFITVGLRKRMFLFPVLTGFDSDHSLCASVRGDLAGHRLKQFELDQSHTRHLG